ncbi:TIGR04219 family outer membrane beta-barrel protein [Gilvimarinus polysaccharolyticus]|uniref:TIGR04219 family outer membrane beta-barrel protein n=1 Tax=Gilvimarinus polysaccharolyticus TaxID=863921 RepID=UPI000673B6CC|nr:TIGR04219 family outer membrane beta-barrel protein [Gilvimarinus polysaccharolyticus]
MRVIFAAPFVAVCLSAISTTAQADFIGVKGDIGFWRSDYAGSVGRAEIPVGTLGYTDEGNRFLHLSVEHPVPLIPNFRLAYSDMVAGRSVPWSGGSASSTIELTHADGTVYYEILDNWVSLDLGFSVRIYDGNISLVTPALTENMEIDEILPMGYALVEAELPFTGWSAGVEGNYTNFNDHQITDYTLKLRYLFDSLVDLGVEIGYRNQSINIDQGMRADLTLDGPYAAFAFHF